MMRSAVCRLIECIALTRLPLSVKQSVELLDTIDTCLKHPNEEIQQAAASAIGALMRTYFPVGANGPSGRLQKRVIDKYVSIVDTEDNPAATRGYSLALGRLPKKLLAPNPQVLNVVLRCCPMLPGSTPGLEMLGTPKRGGMPFLPLSLSVGKLASSIVRELEMASWRQTLLALTKVTYHWHLAPSLLH